MDDILALASELVENNNYKNDSFQEETKPDGVYSVILESAKLKVSPTKGTEWFALDCKVIDGEYIEESFNVNLFLTEKTVKGSLSKLMRLISAAGYEIDMSMFTDKDAIEEGLQTLVGENVLLIKQTSKSGFINYSFEGTGA